MAVVVQDCSWIVLLANEGLLSLICLFILLYPTKGGGGDVITLLFL